MKKLFLTLAIALSALTFTSCTKDKVQPNPVTVELNSLNDDFEDTWIIDRTYYYNDSVNYTTDYTLGVLTITDSTILINSNIYDQYESYDILNTSSDSIINMNIDGYVSNLYTDYYFKYNTTSNSIILVIPSDVYPNDNTKFKLIKAHRN